MSSMCDSCDCADKSNCGKKGNSYGGIVMVDTEKSHLEARQDAAENDGKCKCGTSCSCTNCTCGH